MSTVKKGSYKKYFRGEGGETSMAIPKRTRYRMIKPRRLLPSFNETLIPTGDANEVTMAERNRSDCEAVCSKDSEDIPNLQDTSEEEDAENSLFFHQSVPVLSEDDLSETESESSSIPTDNVNNETDDSQQPLYEGARISQSESLLLMYGFMLRHKLTKSATSDLLNLLNFHMPSGTNVPTSTYLLEKRLAPDFQKATKCYYCPACEQTTDDNGYCSTCKSTLEKSELLKSGKFFVMLDLSSSIQSVLEDPTLQSLLLKSFENRKKACSVEIRDIMQGQLYKNLPFGTYDLSCSINTDGVSLFSSSKFSIWPIFVSINEFEYHVRRRHTLLAGLWFGTSKPNFESFLTPFIDECNLLSEAGLNWMLHGERILTRVFFPIVAADSVARCSLQGIKQFNGEYGCPWCLISGESFTIEGGSRKWIFPPGPAIERRTKFQFIEHLKILKNNLDNNLNDNCFGIKSASSFLRLKYFDIVDGFVFDYMHTCLLGVVKTMMGYWFDSKHHAEIFYLGNKVEEVSKCFMRCKVPFDVSRSTRTLKEYKYWKASEWKTWMLICVPLLQEFLRQPYLNHFAKFVMAVCLLNSSEITEADLDKADVLLKEFCQNAPNLYGKGICSFNMHLLLHVVNCVRNWGPLWAYSLFQFEHLNGIISSYFRGPNQICMQIIRKVIITQHVSSIGRNAFTNTVAKSLFSSFVERKLFNAKVVRCQDVTFLGPNCCYVINDREKAKFSKLGMNNVTEGSSFKTCIIFGKKFNIAATDTEKRGNSVISIGGKRYILVRMIIVNDPQERPVPFVFVKRIYTVTVSNLCNVEKVLEISDSIKIINFSLIEPRKFICTYNNYCKLLYICELPNTVELE